MDANTRKKLRSIGHNLKPVVTIGDKGLSEGVAAELERALDDHELIKVKLPGGDPAARKALAESLCKQHKAELVQNIGRIALILRRAKKPKAQLSNLQRL